MSRHRQEVRPRYGRIAMLGSALVVTAVALLGGVGLLPGDTSPEAAGASSLLKPDADRRAAGGRTAGDDAATRATASGQAGAQDRTEVVVPQERATRRPAKPARGDGTRQRIAVMTAPADSGTGRRVVFSEDLQRVWLVSADERVRRSYLVSGSVHDNLDPGSYAVYSRSERAWGIDDSGAMRWFVRFTQGDNAAIGFHDIPVLGDTPVQTAAQLGTPLSHGCIRQQEADAKALWAFAPLGTTVVVI